MSYIFRGKRKNKKTNKWQFWLGMIFIAMVVIFFGKINWQVHQKGKQLTIKVDQLRSKVNLLQEKKDIACTIINDCLKDPETPGLSWCESEQAFKIFKKLKNL